MTIGKIGGPVYPEYDGAGKQIPGSKKIVPEGSSQAQVAAETAGNLNIFAAQFIPQIPYTFQLDVLSEEHIVVRNIDSKNEKISGVFEHPQALGKGYWNPQAPRA